MDSVWNERKTERTSEGYTVRGAGTLEDGEGSSL